MEQDTQKQLEEKIKTLEARIEELSQRLDAADKRVSDYSELYCQQIVYVSRDIEYAFERIKNVEVTVFPNLLDDLAHAHEIIGYGNYSLTASANKPSSPS